eukprot:364416-Chlamydomonas_euryale.AAC.6
MSSYTTDAVALPPAVPERVAAALRLMPCSCTRCAMHQHGLIQAQRLCLVHCRSATRACAARGASQSAPVLRAGRWMVT